MRFVVRWVFRLFILLIVLSVAAVLLKDMLLKEYLQHRIRTTTGMDVKCTSFEVGLFSPTLDAGGVKVYRPAELGGSLFLDMPDVHLECEAAALARCRLHIKLARISVREMDLIQARDGGVEAGFNLALPRVGEGSRSSTRLRGCTFTGIDTLNLSFGKLTYASVSRPGKRTDVEVGLRNQVVSNVRTLGDLTNLVMQAALRHGLTITEEPARRPKPAPRIAR